MYVQKQYTKTTGKTSVAVCFTLGHTKDFCHYFITQRRNYCHLPLRPGVRPVKHVVKCQTPIEHAKFVTLQVVDPMNEDVVLRIKNITIKSKQGIVQIVQY